MDGEVKIRLTRDLLQQLDDRARELGIDRASLIRSAVIREITAKGAA